MGKRSAGERQCRTPANLYGLSRLALLTESESIVTLAGARQTSAPTPANLAAAEQFRGERDTLTSAAGTLVRCGAAVSDP